MVGRSERTGASRKKCKTSGIRSIKQVEFKIECIGAVAADSKQFNN